MASLALATVLLRRFLENCSNLFQTETKFDVDMTLINSTHLSEKQREFDVQCPLLQPTVENLYVVYISRLLS